MMPSNLRARRRLRQKITRLCAVSAVVSIAQLIVPPGARGNPAATPGTPATHPAPCSLGGAVAGFENLKSVSDGPKGPGRKKGTPSQRGRARA